MTNTTNRLCECVTKGEGVQNPDNFADVLYVWLGMVPYKVGQCRGTVGRLKILKFCKHHLSIALLWVVGAGGKQLPVHGNDVAVL